MPLEQQRGAEARVALQRHQAVPEGAHHVLDGRRCEVGELRVVVGRLDEHLVGADAVHEIVEAFPAPLGRAVDAQRGEPVRDDADAPAGRIGRRVGALPVGEQLRRCLRLVAAAEHARAVGPRGTGDREVRRPANALGRDHHPPTGDRVLAQLGQEAQALAMCCSRPTPARSSTEDGGRWLAADMPAWSWATPRASQEEAAP